MKDKNGYKELYDDTVACSKTACRLTGLTILGSCLLASAIPLAYLSACEDSVNMMMGKFNRGTDDESAS